MCIKCNSCKNPLQLSIDRSNLEIHLICDLCNSSENYTLSASQILSLELCTPAIRLRKAELFITLNNAKKGGEPPATLEVCEDSELFRFRNGYFQIKVGDTYAVIPGSDDPKRNTASAKLADRILTLLNS